MSLVIGKLLYDQEFLFATFSNIKENHKSSSLDNDDVDNNWHRKTGVPNLICAAPRIGTDV